MNFKLGCDLRARASLAFKAQTIRKTIEIFNLFGCPHFSLKSWLIHQVSGDMIVENNGFCLGYRSLFSNTFIQSFR